jgi:hypothetical protein
MNVQTVYDVLTKNWESVSRSMAGELGFEPRLTESESAVLPLNYSPVTPQILKNIRFFKMKEVDVRVEAGARD